MKDVLKLTSEYRNQVLDVLKQNKKHFGTEFKRYTTPSGNHTVEYYRWLHPYQGNWELAEIFTDTILSFVKNNISKDSVVLDIGAQAGLMSVLFSQTGAKVISFEPNPAVFEVLDKNTEIYKNIIPYNVACSREDSILEFHYSDEGFCNGGFATDCEVGIGVTGHTVPMDVYAVNLPQFLNDYHADDINKISLIKIDAEGHDKEILKTLKDVILKVKPMIITEMYSGLTKPEIDDLISTIHSLSYEIFDIGKTNSGLGIINHRKKVRTSNDVIIGHLCNFVCLPTNK
jgi:hypothetical protein